MVRAGRERVVGALEVEVVLVGGRSGGGERSRSMRSENRGGSSVGE